DNAADRLTVFRLIAAGDDLDLLHGLGRQLRADGRARDGVLHRHALDAEERFVAAAAADVNVVAFAGDSDLSRHDVRDLVDGELAGVRGARLPQGRHLRQVDERTGVENDDFLRGPRGGLLVQQEARLSRSPRRHRDGVEARFVTEVGGAYVILAGRHVAD